MKNKRQHACSVVSDSLWPVDCSQAPLSMEFSRQEDWSGLPSPAPGDLPDTGIEPGSLGSPALAGRFLTTAPPVVPSEGGGQRCRLNVGWVFFRGCMKKMNFVKNDSFWGNTYHLILIISQGKDCQAMSRLKKKIIETGSGWVIYPGLGRGWAVRGAVGGEQGRE